MVQWGREDLAMKNPWSKHGVVKPPVQKPQLCCKPGIWEKRGGCFTYTSAGFSQVPPTLCRAFGACSEQLCQVEHYAPGTKLGFHLVGRCLWYVAKTVFYCKLPV